MEIYKITNKINGKIYIGLTTVGLYRRMASYKSNVKAKRTKGQWILAAMIKYGFENFEFEIIDIASDRKKLKNKEIFYIKKFDAMNPTVGYNRDSGGSLHTESMLLQKSQKLKNKPLTQEHKNKISAELMGHKVSKETRKKQSEAKLGRPTWNKNSKSIMKPNSGSFAVEKPAPNKGRKRIFVDGKIRYVEVSGGT